MRRLEAALRELADSERPLVEVLDPAGGTARVHSYREVTRAAGALAERVAEGARVGVVCGNTPEFVVADLALLSAGATEVPVPLAFSAEQAASLLDEVDLCLVDGPGARRVAEWGVLRPDCPVEVVDLAALRAPDRPYRVRDSAHDWIAKVIHTSGTTSRPKGVRIRAHGLDSLLDSLDGEMPAGAFRRYLSVVPYSLLIEQVTGLYLPILHGGSVSLLPPEAALVGTAASAAQEVLRFLPAARPTALVCTPALVERIADAARRAGPGADLAAELFGTATVPLLCCGGAPVRPELLEELDGRGIAVYEGYGLSENGSVVSWNRPGACRYGTVGTPLPHVRVRLDPDGELLVRSSSLFAGYTRDDPSSCVVDDDGWLRTGDLAEIDEAGFIRITGRKKNVIITSAGRNVAPEWVEARYATLPFVRAVAVVGNGLPALHGLLLVDPGTDLEVARSALRDFGARALSEVERIDFAHVVPSAEQLYRRFFTVTGRPVRPAVEQAVSTGELAMTPLIREDQP